MDYRKILRDFYKEILELDDILDTDDFFELGGDSFDVTILGNKIEEITGIKINADDIFEYATIEELADYIAKKGEDAPVFERIPKAEKKESYQMSSSQKRTYLIQQMDPESTVYNMPRALNLTGNVDADRMRKSLNMLIQRHEILRTDFVMEEGELKQKIRENVEAEFVYAEDEKTPEKELKEDFVRAFDLSKSPLVRMKLTKREEKHLLFVDMHHIVGDGMSMGTFLRELSKIYHKQELKELGVQYKDYSEWMRVRDLASQKEYWKQVFEEEIPILDMPLDYNRPKEQSFRGGVRTGRITEETGTRIRGLAKESGSTEYMVFLSAAMALLGRYSRQEDVVIGSPVSGRTHSDTESMLGMFVNTLAMRGKPEREKSFQKLLEEVKENSLKAYENQEYPFEELVEEVEVRRDLSRNPLFDVMLTIRDSKFNEFEFNGTVEKAEVLTNGIAKVDLVFILEAVNKGYNVKLEYCSDLYKESSAERILRSYIAILEQVSQDKTVKLKGLELISEDEKEQILTVFNDTNSAYPKEKTVVELFEEQVELRPEKTAIVYEGKSLSYRELNERANQLAYILRKKGVERDRCVGIVGEKSFEMIIGIFGILKAGGAYIPMDPKQPKERLHYMIEDSKPRVVLTYQVEIETEREVIDLGNPKVYESAPKSNLERINKPEDLLYVIYTSGTMGKPKGVLIEHRGAVRLVKNVRYITLDEQTKILQTGALSFDASTFEIYGALLNGGELVLARTEELTDSATFSEILREHEINTIWMTSTLFNQMISFNHGIFDSVTYVLAGGEKLSETHIKQLVKRKTANVINGYGPTESTTFTTTYRITEVEHNIPIGKPISNTKVYILDEKKLCGIGLPGELCIAGDGLARGYLNQEELTKEKFIDNPYGEGKLYRTGDLARWLLDGNIEYLGRMDEQVKIRGYRIELGEIETVLRKQPKVKEAAVIVRMDKSGDKTLHGYVVAEGEITVSDLREGMLKELPEYMVPNYLMAIEKIPVTNNGKLDKKSLPKIEVKTETSYAAPKNEREVILSGIFKEILGIERVSVKDSFFELGGHSLRATRLINQMEEKTGVRIGLKDVFGNATIEQLSQLIEGKDKQYEKIPRVKTKESYEMSSSQKRIYLIQEMDRESTVYNMPRALRLWGEVDAAKLKQSLNAMIQRHEILRTNFVMEEGELKQRIQTSAEAEFFYEEDKRTSEEELVEAFVRAFDLSKGPLVRMKLVKREKGYLLFIDMHHIIGDGMSMGTFMLEYSRLYNGHELNKLDIQYKDYSEWMQVRDLTSQKKYWKEIFDEEIPVLNIPLDYNRQKEQSFRGDKITVRMEEGAGQRIRDLSKESESTEYMVFLSAAMALLGRYSRQEDVVIGSPVSGRTHRETEHLLGIFVNTLAMRGNPKREKSFGKLLEEIKEGSLKAYENQEYPFEALVEEVEVRRDLSRNPLFDVMLVMQNNENAGYELNNVEVEPIQLERKIAKFDLTFHIMEDKGGYVISLEYCSDLYKKSSAERMLNTYIRVLEQVCKNKNVKIQDLDLISEEEKLQILSVFNNTDNVYPREKTVVELFEEQVEKGPEKTAVVFEGKKLSYQELNERVNQLAHVLREKGVTRESYVGIASERSIEMIVGIYGIIKAGGAYVPIDPEYPSERIRYIIEDSNPKVILTYKAKIETEREVIDLGNLKVYESAPKHNPEPVNEPKDLLYVIYTSGTTGKPKGVQIQHQNVVNFCHQGKTHQLVNELKEKCEYIYASNKIIFDITVQEIFLPLLNHLGIVIAKDPMTYDEIKQKNLGLISTPTKFSNYLTQPAFRKKLKDFTVIMLGAEEFKTDVIKNVLKEPSITLLNGYGPTETTCGVLYHQIQDKNIQKVPIGKPINNTRIYILDGEKLCGIGLPGELCIAGDGLARGYLNQEEQTKEKFINNPYGEGKLYRTGDLARWLLDGTVEYLGRIDEQVKIRGYRIELGEIEAVLSKQPGVKEAAVIVRTDQTGDEALHGYVVAEEDIKESSLREGLLRELPEYMVPNYLMKIEKIPMTGNGKLDKRSLPEIEARAKNTYIGPRNEKEAMLCEIFQEILSVKKVGVADSFFELGGHSLRATRLVNRIEEETGVRIGLKEVFGNPTVEQLCLLTKGREIQYEGMKRAEDKESYEMSSSQKRTYLIQEMDRESTVYNISEAMKLKGDVDVLRLKKSLNTLVKRHEILRTNFVMEEGELKQRIRETAEADFVYEKDEETLENELMKGFVRAFDLSKDSLVRMKLIKRKEGYLLLCDMHHIVGDGMSMEIFWQEFSNIYNGEEQKKLKVQYKDYSEWMRERDFTSQKEYWKEVFEEEIPILNMPLDYSRPKEQSFRGSMKIGTITAQTQKRIKDLAKESESTEYMVFLSAAMALLGRYSRQEDVVIGSPVSGRTHSVTERMLGMFVNTLAMRGKPEREKSFETLLEEMKEGCLKAYENQEYPFEELVEEVNVPRDLSRNPLFDVMLALQNNEQSGYELNGIEMEPIRQESQIAKFDLTFSIREKETGYQITLEYCSDLYKGSSAERILNAYISVLEQVSKDKNVKIKDLELISEEEKEQVLTKFQDTDCDYPREKTVVELFEEQVEKHPEKTAVVYDGETLSYRELNIRANQLAHILRKKGVERESCVGIVSERGLEMLVGIFGIIKAGGAYIPMDPQYPTERIRYIIEDSKMKVVLAYKTEIETEHEVIDIGDPMVYESAPKENPKKVNQPNDLLYVIYTSGTTGKPKGVLIEHQNVVNFCSCGHMNQLVNELKNKCEYIYASNKIIFDITVQEIFLPLLNDLGIIIAKDAIVYDEIEQKNLGLISTSTKFGNYLLQPAFKKKLKDFNVIMLGAEEFKTDLLHDILKEQSITIFNGYGPTETTCGVLYYQVEDENAVKVPIGRPINNIRIYILDGDKLCGIGMPGELCIAGDGLARGYLNQEELTKEKFIDNPYGEGKLYRTGDLAKWLLDGTVEYLGRIDEQVKIRGYRIEPGEVSSILRKQPAVKEAVVIVRTDSTGEKALHGYVVAEEKIKVSDLREGMLKELPEYMVPGYLMQIEEIPVTQSGKLDKKSLPEIQARTGNEYVAPRNEREALLCEIFQEILGVEKVSVTDSFFELGGHSLRATSLVNRMEEKTGVRIRLKDVFGNATAEQLSRLIEGQEAHYERIPKAEKQESYLMSASQKRTYLIQEMDQNSTVYNMPRALKLTGDVDVDRLRRSLNLLVKRHEILRTDFVMEEGELKQRINETTEAEFSYIDDEKTSEEELLAAFVRPFDLSQSPLVRMKLVNRKEGFLLLFDMHHIVSDGMSMGIFMSEFSKIYNGEEQKEWNVQYKDYSEWMRKRNITSQKAYWKGVFADEIPVLNMPSDYNRPKEQSFQGGLKIGKLTEGMGEHIRGLAKETESTEYMVFLSAAMVLLGRYSRQEDIVIGSPVSGRTHRDTEHMLGMFVNTLAMRGKPEREKSFEKLLEEIKEGSLKAYENQEYPFEELVEEVNIKRDLSRNPLFDVMLVMQNNERAEYNLNGIEVELIKQDSKIAKFDLTFHIMKDKGGYMIALEYCSDLYRESSAESILNTYLKVLEQVCGDRKIKIKDFDLISEKEKEQVLLAFNDTNSFYPREKTVVELFEEQVELRAEETAVIYEGKKLSYRELNERANQLAHVLRDKGVGADSCVGIISEKSLEMIIGIFGILKAGGAYVPIDPGYPMERIGYLIEDSRPKVVLTYRTKIETKVEVLDLENSQIYQGVPKNNPKRVNHPKDLMYVIYTSGTTGKPKGVLIEHRSAVRLVKGVDYVTLNERTKILQTGALSFDASTFEIYGALLNGGQLVLVNTEELTDGGKLREKLKEYGINTLWLTSTLFNQMISFNEEMFDSVLNVMVGGEKLSETHIKKLAERKTANVINGYGPTESTTFTTTYRIDEVKHNIPIGKPISNTKVYILDGEKLCGIGMPGELCIAGDGLARGYLNQEALTREKFMDNPYGSGSLYRTGDLAKWLEDGNIEYLGRIDEQVKIRGFRIELGEIEAILRKQAKIKDAAVIVRTDKSGDKALHGYVTAEEEIKVSELREKLSRELPEYMVPGYLMEIEKIPMTQNGKLDKKSLPQIEAKTENIYIGPRNEKEMALSESFKEILGVQEVSIKDSFFELGGDSIKGIRVVSKMREAGYDMNVKDVMSGQTIEEISERLKKAEALFYEQGEVKGHVKATPIIEVFQSWKLEEPHHFNQAMMIKVDGNETQVEEAIKALISHHDMLRGVYRDGGLEILENKGKCYGYEVYDCCEEDEVREKIEEKQRNMDLEHGPLFQSVLFQKKTEAYLFLCLHHLIVDGVSWRILIEDIHKGIKQQREGKAIKLPKKTASYQDWSEALLKYKESKKLQKERAYWNEIEEKMNEGKYEGKTREESGYGSVSFKLDKEETKSLLTDSKEAYNTEINDLLLSGLGMAVKEMSGQKNVTVTLEGHGREELHKKIEVDRTVGWFTSMYPVIVECHQEIEKSIIRTKEMLRRVPNHGIGYGLLAEKKKESDISFNYLGEIGEGNETEKIYSTGTSISEKNRLPGRITINGSVQEGELTFVISYDRSKYGEKEIKALAEAYEEKLKDEILHCCVSEGNVITASDVSDEIISEDDLDQILSIF